MKCLHERARARADCIHLSNLVDAGDTTGGEVMDGGGDHAFLSASSAAAAAGPSSRTYWAPMHSPEEPGEPDGAPPSHVEHGPPRP